MRIDKWIDFIGTRQQRGVIVCICGVSWGMEGEIPMMDLESMRDPIRLSNPYRGIGIGMIRFTSEGGYMGSEGGLYGVTQYALFTPEHIGILL